MVRAIVLVTFVGFLFSGCVSPKIESLTYLSGDSVSTLRAGMPAIVLLRTSGLGKKRASVSFTRLPRKPVMELYSSDHEVLVESSEGMLPIIHDEEAGDTLFLKSSSGNEVYDYYLFFTLPRVQQPYLSLSVDSTRSFNGEKGFITRSDYLSLNGKLSFDYDKTLQDQCPNMYFNLKSVKVSFKDNLKVEFADFRVNDLNNTFSCDVSYLSSFLLKEKTRFTFYVEYKVVLDCGYEYTHTEMLHATYFP